jgi:hypothetical protein
MIALYVLTGMMAGIVAGFVLGAAWQAANRGVR